MVAGANPVTAMQFAAQRFDSAHLGPFLKAFDDVRNSNPDRQWDIVQLAIGRRRDIDRCHPMQNDNTQALKVNLKLH